MGLLLSGAIAFAAVSAYYQGVAAELRLARGQVEELRQLANRNATVLQNKSEQSAEQRQEIHRANEVIRQLSLPWDTLFNAVESAKSNRIALLSITPDAQQRMLKVGGEAKDYTAALDYAMRLGDHDLLRNVYLLNHEVQQQEPQKPVRFVVVATWNIKQ